MYSDDEIGVPPEELYTRKDAVQALEDALKVVEVVKRLLNEVLAKQT